MKRLALFIAFFVIAVAPVMAFWGYGSRREAEDACWAWKDKGKKELHTFTLPKKFELTSKDNEFIREKIERLCPSKPCNARAEDLGSQLDCISFCKVRVEDEVIESLRYQRRDERVEVKEFRSVRRCEDESQTRKVLGIEKGNVRKRFSY